MAAMPMRDPKSSYISVIGCMVLVLGVDRFMSEARSITNLLYQRP